MLVLCTGNICRSPMAELLLRHAFHTYDIPALVRSSGFVNEGQPATPEVVELMATRGLDASTHRSTVTTAELLGWADLVIAMTTEHLKQAVLLSSDAFERTFLLKELVATIEENEPRVDGETVPEYLARLGDGRQKTDFLRILPDREVADPFGRRMRVYRTTAAELDQLTSRLVAGLWPDKAGESVPAAG